jgi:monothiol glutaredoxin
MILVSPVFDATANEDDLAVWQLFQRLAPPPAFKMWSGWPTFPIVFVKGVLVRGASDLDRLIASGELARMLPGTSGSA